MPINSKISEINNLNVFKKNRKNNMNTFKSKTINITRVSNPSSKEKSREKNIRIYGGTLLPFKGYRLYSEQKNDIRNKVNDWIRNCKNIKEGFDDFIDFDLIIRDPEDINKSLNKVRKALKEIRYTGSFGVRGPRKTDMISTDSQEEKQETEAAEAISA